MHTAWQVLAIEYGVVLGAPAIAILGWVHRRLMASYRAIWR